MSSSLFRTRSSKEASETLPIDRWLDESTAKSFANIEQRPNSAGNGNLPLQKLNDWRALTAELLSKCDLQEVSSTCTMEYLRRMAKDVMRTIESWAVPKERQKLENTLYDVYVKATEFSHLIRQQRACWSVRFPQRCPLSSLGEVYQLDKPRLMFDPSEMKDEWDEDEDRTDKELLLEYVEMVISPALYKRGTVDGEHFDVEFPAEKAKVIMYHR